MSAEARRTKAGPRNGSHQPPKGPPLAAAAGAHLLRQQLNLETRADFFPSVIYSLSNGFLHSAGARRDASAFPVLTPSAFASSLEVRAFCGGSIVSGRDLVREKTAKDDLDVVGSTDAEPVVAEPTPGRRVILLSGDAFVRESVYHMEGTLFVSADGAIEGEILWTVARSPYLSTGRAGVEFVRGSATPTNLTFSGYKIEGPFLKERYRLTLFGAEEAGVFEGASEAYGEWDARLSGSYQVVTERG